MPKGRSHLEIRIEILENSMENIKPTALMSATNLNWGKMNEEISSLKTRGLIEEITMVEEEFKRDRRTKVKYRATAAGMHVVNMMKVVRKSID